ncbi:MAG: aminoacyl--tRNA ligase-related protein [bacterium]
MRYSNIFSKTSKSAPSDADCINARLLEQAGFVSKQMAGVYIYLPLGLRVLTKIQNIIREEMDSIGANEVLMPALTQKSSYTTTKRDNLDILFHLKGRSNTELVLNISHEEVVTPLAQKYVFSHRDLPFAVYQIQNKYRNEPRAKSGILRGREFNMKDLYSFNKTEQELDEYYEKIKASYFKIFQKIGIGGITYLTFASGGSFSKYSHEFQTLCDVGEDTIYLCEKCKVAVNKEIIKDQNSCPMCGEKKLVEKNAIEVGNIFKLKTKFSDAFEFTYIDEQGKKQLIFMGCYGIGPSRVMGALVEIFHDERGIIWPELVAPYKVHLLNLGESDEIKKSVEKVYEQLLAKEIEVLYDDRHLSAGEKLADADLIGCPIRVVVSTKTIAQDSVEVKKRSDNKIELVKLSKIAGQLAKKESIS